MKTSKSTNCSIGLMWKYIRLSSGLSVRELSTQMGLSHTSIHHIERGRSIPQLKNVIRFCEIMGVESGDLLSLLPKKDVSDAAKIRLFNKIAKLEENDYGM